MLQSYYLYCSFGPACEMRANTGIFTQALITALPPELAFLYFILTKLENNITHLMAGFGVIKTYLQREQDLLLTHLNAVKRLLIIKQHSRK